MSWSTARAERRVEPRASIGAPLTPPEGTTKMNGHYGAWCCAFLAVATLAATSACAAGDSGRGRHAQFYVVPAPGKVVVDARLDEWDLSGQIEMFVVEATRSSQTGKTAAMYDEQALYLCGEIADSTPMMNRHDPKVRANKAWDADSVQFRMVVDPDAAYPVKESAFTYRGKDAPPDTRDDIVHLLLWHFTDDRSANLQMHVGMGYRLPRAEWAPHGLVPRDMFDGAYRTWDDGSGYTFEYRIPWKTLGAKRPLAAGDMVAGTVNVFWSRHDGLKTAGGNAWAYDILGQSGFPFQSAECWGKVFFAEEGNVSRNLVEQGVAPEKPQPLEFAYDVPEDATVTLQLFDADGQAKRIIVAQESRTGGKNVERWDGLDDNGKLLPAGTYRWRGVYNTGTLAAKHRFSAHNSGRPPHPTDDNTGGWGGDHGVPTTAAVFDEGVLLAWSGAEYGWGLIRTDFDGRKQWGCKHDAKHVASDGERIYFAGGHHFRKSRGVRMLTLEDSRPARLPNDVAVFPPPSGGARDDNEITGLACGGGRLYVAHGGWDLVAGYDTTTGEMLATWDVTAAGRLAVRPDGTVAVISDETVVIVSPTGATRTWLDAHLDDPQGIAVGRDGTAYVSNRGRLQNVSAFSSDGRYLRSIGVKGGRPAVGTYDPNGMYHPGGIALDRRGRLWVAENAGAPKRFSVWDARSGRLVAEYFGGSSYFAYGTIDPARPDEVYAHNVMWEIDWKNYTVCPKTTIWRPVEPDMAPAPSVDAYTSGGGFRLVTAKNGRQFGWGGAPHGDVFLYMRDGDVFRPIVGSIDPWRNNRGNCPVFDGLRAYLDAQWDKQKIRKHKRPRSLFWQDEGDDGVMQVYEFAVREGPRAGRGSIIRMEEDLSLWLSSGHRLRPREVTAEGRPIYDLVDAEDTPLRGKLRGHGWTVIDDDGSAYVLNHSDGPSLIKWSADGRMPWNYPGLVMWKKALNLPTVGPGRLWSMTRPMGMAGEYILYQTYNGACQLFRTDGTYIGCLLQDGRNAETVGAHTGQPEGQGGSFMRLEIDGKARSFMIHGGQDVRVWEVLGLDTIKDLPGGAYVHTDEHVARARKAQREYLAATAEQKEIRIVRGRDRLDDAAPAVRKIEGDRGFEARVAYDARNLYVRFDVTAPHGLVNGQSDPRIIFRGGNCLDIQLATDPDADPKREKPAPGDVRLLVTRKDTTPFAMLYRPRIAGFRGKPTVLESPTGTESFDDIAEVDVELVYEKPRKKKGFTATVTIPLATLGFRPVRGQKVRMDLGYVFGNSHGTRTVTRAYINNESFSANVVDDIPNESRLEPDEWGTATVE